MVTLVALIIWRIPPWFVAPIALTFLSMDGAFLSAALTKVPLGAWFTLALATVLASVFILWRFGKEQQWAAEKEDRLPLSQFVELNDDGDFTLAAINGQKGGETLTTTKGFGVFFDKGGINTPQAFSTHHVPTSYCSVANTAKGHFIGKLVSTPEVIVFFHMRPLEYPTVPAEERFVVSQIRSLPNCYRYVASLFPDWF